MIWESLRGHQEQVEMFRRSLARGRLSSAYLFSGSAGIGKKLFARMLAQSLFCKQFPETALDACGECSNCLQMQAGTYPDFFSIERKTGKKFLTIDLFIGTDESRGHDGLCYQIALKPMSGDRRVAMIDDVELMNAESANSLLKTLEEPPEGAIIILISSNPQALLPTILSRCQQVFFSPLASTDIVELLIKQEVVTDRQEAEQIAATCEGSLTAAAKWVDPALCQLRETLHQHLAQGNKMQNVTVAKELVTLLDEMSDGAQEQRQNGRRLIQFAVEFYHQSARASSGLSSSINSSASQRFLQSLTLPLSEKLETIAELADRATLSDQQLERSMPIPLCLEALCADLARINRAATNHVTS